MGSIDGNESFKLEIEFEWKIFKYLVATTVMLHDEGEKMRRIHFKFDTKLDYTILAILLCLIVKLKIC